MQIIVRFMWNWNACGRLLLKIFYKIISNKSLIDQWAQISHSQGGAVHFVSLYQNFIPDYFDQKMLTMKTLQRPSIKSVLSSVWTFDYSNYFTKNISSDRALIRSSPFFFVIVVPNNYFLNQITQKNSVALPVPYSMTFSK